jgi:hypothetical protein
LPLPVRVSHQIQRHYCQQGRKIASAKQGKFVEIRVITEATSGRFPAPLCFGRKKMTVSKLSVIADHLRRGTIPARFQPPPVNVVTFNPRDLFECLEYVLDNHSRL